MAEQTRQPDDEAPNHASSMEKAEGSRDHVQDESGHQTNAGITNRPLDEEQQEQGSLPPRGQRKDDTSHA